MLLMKWGVRALAVAGLVATLGTPAKALTIDPGFDLFMTDPGTTFVDFSGFGGPPVFPLKGVPLAGDPLFAGLGTTDTIVRRLAGTNLTNIGDFDTVPIELVALSLHSVAPIQIGPSFFDVQVIGGSLLGVPQQLGQMTIVLTEPNGGTFDAQLPVSAQLVFSEVGNPSTQVASSFFDIFTSLDVPWTSDRPKHDKHNADFPPGGFFPGIDPLTGRPVLVIEQALDQAGNLVAQHGVVPAIVAPGALALFGLGIVALAAVRSRVRTLRVG